MLKNRVSTVAATAAMVMVFACIPPPASSVSTPADSLPALTLPQQAFQHAAAMALSLSPATLPAAAPLYRNIMIRTANGLNTPPVAADAAAEANGDRVSVAAQPQAPAKVTPPAARNSARVSPSGLVTTAQRYSGVRYRWAGMTSRGMDCSGFIARVLKAHGIRAPHNSAQLYSLGRRVRFEELQPGDLMFFHTGRRGISHVGMYVGDDKFIHASSGAGRVVTTSVYDPYYVKRLVGARRLD